MAFGLFLLRGESPILYLSHFQCAVMVMREIIYLDFDLLLERLREQYIARVLNSPAGQAAGKFNQPFSDLELENFLLRVGRSRRGMRRVDSLAMEAAKIFGGRLFDAVFGSEVRACLRSSLAEAERQGAGLRLRLRLNAPELVDLPWEYFYIRSLNRFLSLSKETPLVRYLELPERIRPLAVKPPLRVLVMISGPHDYPRLEVEREWEKLNEVLCGLRNQGLLILERLEKASLAELQRILRQNEYHAFHFIGHGGFDKQSQDGVLMLEDEEGFGCPLSGQYLGTLLHNHPSLRLAILNACEGARSSRSDPFSGTAQSLIQQGIPAVIAMQFEISDEAAITFAREFYAALADGYPVDAALVEVRTAIFARGNDLEWGTPVLYMRSPDGQIFAIERRADAAENTLAANDPTKDSPAQNQKSVEAQHLLEEGKSLLEKNEYSEALEKFRALWEFDPKNEEIVGLIAECERGLLASWEDQEKKSHKIPEARKPGSASTPVKEFLAGKKLVIFLALVILLAVPIIKKQWGKLAKSPTNPAAEVITTPTLAIAVSAKEQMAQTKIQAEANHAALYAAEFSALAGKNEEDANRALQLNKYAVAESLFEAAHRGYLQALEKAVAVVEELKNAAKAARQKAMAAQREALNNRAEAVQTYRFAVGQLEKGDEEWGNGHYQEAQSAFAAAEEMFIRAAKEAAELRVAKAVSESLIAEVGAEEKKVARARRSAEENEAKAFAAEAFAYASNQESQGRQDLARENYAEALAAFREAVKGYEQVVYEKSVLENAETLYQKGDYGNSLLELSRVFADTPYRGENKMATELSKIVNNAKTLREQKIAEADAAANRGDLGKALALLHELPARDSHWVQNKKDEIMKKDHDAPQIEHTPVGKYDRKKSLTLRVTVQDNIEVAQVLLHYQTKNNAVYASAAMQGVAKDVYEYTIPAEIHQGREIRYYIFAKDTNGCARTLRSKDNPFKVKTEDHVPHIQIP